MVREVPFRPPWLLALLLAGALLVPVAGLKAQEKQASAENQSAVEAKARLLQELDQQIEQRRRELAREEQSLAALRHTIEAATRALVEERDRLQALKQELEADIQRREILVDERLTQIARVYGAMKPKEAAQALQGMDDEMAVAILERLPGRTVGKLFNVMPKDRVRQLTLRLEEGAANTGE